jgi:excisionase family DNA binding protein
MTGNVSGRTLRRDDDRPAAPAPRPETWTSRLGRSGQDPRSGRLACSVNEAARLTGLSRDLLYDEMRRGNLASVKAGRRRLITRQHPQQFPGIAS